ncbi:MAG: glycosyltransferase family 39 protein [Anaerolinea sp.]|nr:glycosyltransferase family 39 protein [Anaerolinea sp.]
MDLALISGWIAAAAPPLLALPLAVTLLTGAQRGASAALTALTALGLSAGLIALIMFWIGLLNIPLSAAAILILYAAVAVLGIVLRLRTGGLTCPPSGLPRSSGRRAVLLIALVTGGAALFNGLYWPFKTDDALGIYQPQAAQIYRTGALIPLTGADSLYRAYPMLVQFNYAFVYFAAGWEHEYAAKLVPTLLALGGLIAVYELARLIRSPRAGWLAVALLALMPAFPRWASSGYVDLPMATYYALAVLFTLRGLRGDGRAILLSAVWIGLAAWTKNAALIGVGLWGVALASGWLTGRIALRTWIAALALAALIAGPWYLRNAIGAGFILPATAWTDQARRTLDTLLIYIGLPDNFGLTGAIILGAVAWALLRLVRGRPAERVDLTVVLWFTLPFFAAWWLFASYDPRFLLLFTPILTALAGVFLDATAPPLPRVVRRALVTAGLIAALYIAFQSVDYKDETLRDPWMSHADKLILVGRTG